MAEAPPPLSPTVDLIPAGAKVRWCIPIVPKSAWAPDTSSKDCSVCHASFSLFNRRHHCRACGCLVCDKCSSEISLSVARDGGGTGSANTAAAADTRAAGSHHWLALTCHPCQGLQAALDAVADQCTTLERLVAERNAAAAQPVEHDPRSKPANKPGQVVQACKMLRALWAGLQQKAGARASDGFARVLAEASIRVTPLMDEAPHEDAADTPTASGPGSPAGAAASPSEALPVTEATELVECHQCHATMMAADAAKHRGVCAPPSPS